MPETEGEQALYKRLGALEGDVARQGATLEQVVSTLGEMRNELKAARQPWTAVLSAGAAGVGIILLIVSQWTANVASGTDANAVALREMMEIVREHQLDSAERVGTHSERFETIRSTLTNEITRRQDTEQYILAEVKEANRSAGRVKVEVDETLQREMRLLDTTLQREMRLSNEKQDSEIGQLQAQVKQTLDLTIAHDQEVRGLNGDQTARIRALESQMARAREDPFTGSQGRDLTRRVERIENLTDQAP